MTYPKSPMSSKSRNWSFNVCLEHNFFSEPNIAVSISHVYKKLISGKASKSSLWSFGKFVFLKSVEQMKTNYWKQIPLLWEVKEIYPCPRISYPSHQIPIALLFFTNELIFVKFSYKF